MIAVILLQSSKGSGLSGTFGGGSSNVTAVFGARRTSDFLTKSTVVLACIFLVSCLLINIYISKSDGVDESIIQQNAGQQQQQVPPTMDPNQVPPPQENQQPTQTQPVDTTKK